MLPHLFEKMKTRNAKVSILYLVSEGEVGSLAIRVWTHVGLNEIGPRCELLKCTEQMDVIDKASGIHRGGVGGGC